MRQNIQLMLLAGIVFVMTGCASMSEYMEVSHDISPKPAAGNALVIFMRPSLFGGAIQSSVYDVREASDDKFIGIVSAKTKIAYQATPGEHLFMVIGENADFMRAHLDAGKTYYVLVKVRPGFWKARFSLIPIHIDPAAEYNTNSKDFNEWQRETQFVKVTPAAEQWYRGHEKDIVSKKKEYLQKWHAMAEPDKEALTLNAKDGS